MSKWFRFFRYASLAVLSCTACGRYSPVVDNETDVTALDAQETIVRARRLPNESISGLSRLQHLRQLDFSSGWKSYSSQLADAGLANLAAIELPALEVLDLGYCQKFSDTGLTHVARLRTVNWLSLRKCDQLTDAGLVELVAMTNLLGLDLRGCVWVSDSSTEVLSKMEQLRDLWLGGCTSLSDSALDKLRAGLPGCKVEKDDRAWNQLQ